MNKCKQNVSGIKKQRSGYSKFYLENCDCEGCCLRENIDRKADLLYARLPLFIHTGRLDKHNVEYNSYSLSKIEDDITRFYTIMFSQIYGINKKIHIDMFKLKEYLSKEE